MEATTKEIAADLSKLEANDSATPESAKLTRVFAELDDLQLALVGGGSIVNTL